MAPEGGPDAIARRNSNRIVYVLVICRIPTHDEKRTINPASIIEKKRSGSLVMRALGIDLKKQEVRWCLMEGTLSSPFYLCHGRKKYGLDSNRATFFNTFRNIFVEIINERSPDIVVYRVSTNASSIEQMTYLLMPYGVLGSICHDKSIRICETNKRAFTYKKFDLAKGVDPLEHWLAIHGATTPHWDESQQNATLSAWSGLNV
jgi:hypothetical protein